MGSPNQNKSFLYRKTKHDHKNRSERSNASIVARKRLSQPLDTNETESSKVETDSLPECDLVDYHWKGSRKPLILNSFVMVWRNLLDRDFVTWDDRTEQSIYKDLESRLEKEEIKRIVTYIKQRIQDILFSVCE
ncbi:uncharacterized protein [Blastocystis hominis]|uniref:Uncharacterized protein n=1 Tax=Blastocystis hominis TaxID=12968 RepID=D8M7V6_BLAHO|nr:uncharacterized protein [Blastocystis hominis]CBK24145.2 unnamed protein product [Blastocystis hominis]|eukprot:XP_012898193.1 uncharacterized protein [Blastocystis hominis]